MERISNLTVEEKIIEKLEGIMSQLAGYLEDPEVPDEIKSYNEGVAISLAKVNSIVDNYETIIKDGQAEVTVGFLGGTEKHTFGTINEAIETLSVDYSSDLFAVSVPTLPISAIFEMELAREKGLQIWELFDKAKENKHEEWAQWTLANSNLVAAAWITERYDIL